MNLAFRVCALLVAALLTTSCATHYGPNTLFGGYKETRIDDARFRVKFDGNGYASQERVWSFWIYRCAELTKQNGYAYFGLERPPVQTSSISGPGPIRNVVYQPGDGPRFVQTGASYVPIYIPGGRVTTWHTDAVVVMFKELPSDGTPVLRAQSVLDDLDPYVKSNGATVPVSRDEVLSHAAVIQPRTGNGRPGTPSTNGRYRYVGSIGRDQFTVDVESIRRDGDIVRYRLRSSNSDAASPVVYEGLIGVDCQKRTRMEFEHAVSLNRGPMRRSALVPEPKTVFAGTRQELELNVVCELARDLT